MEDPQLEIRDVLRLIVSSPSADDQAAAVKKYFIHNAGFNHPLFHIEPGPSSRSTILGVYQWLLTVASRVEVEIRSIVYERANHVLIVESVLSVHFKLWPFQPVPCHVTSRFSLRKEKHLFFISMQKDLCQLDDLAALVCPPLFPAIRWLRYGTAVTLTIGAKSAQVFGLWRPSHAVAPIETEQVASEENDVELDTRGNKKQKKDDEKADNGGELLGPERDSVPSNANGRRKRKQGGHRERNPGPYGPYSTGSIKNVD